MCKSSPSKIWAIRAFAGSSDIANSQPCVDCTLDPFGIVTMRGSITGTGAATGASVTKKLLVTPESKILNPLCCLG